jgi:Ca2+-binding RTX toxin-like protein
MLASALAADADARPRCAGKKATIVGGPGDNVINVPKHGVQVIVGGGGDDKIVALRNKDRVCGGPGDDAIFAGTGRDLVYGGPGDDYLDLGPGGDKARGGADNDTIVGGGGGDKAHGGDGADRVLGEIQDDKVFGDDDDDLVSGGQGVDALEGGGGSDWLRGDTNKDRYNGGEGSDTLSFATATPPGPFHIDGVIANLSAGKASGDDRGERIKHVENLVGSMFDDRLVGRGTGFVRGELGSNSCSGFRSEACGSHSPDGPEAMITDGGSPDPGLVLMGGSEGDSWTISGGGSSYRISGSALQPGAGCSRVAAGEVVCSTSVPLGYVLAWGGRGGDLIKASGLPATALIKFDGGLGDDSLHGGSGSDLLWAGEGGEDLLEGGGGDDALVSRAGGADRLFGGNGNDQLVTDSPCAGHLYSGGHGHADVAGFGHVQRRGVDARIGGKGRFRGVKGCDASRIRGNNEVLEGSRFGDILIASGGGDLLIGRKGADRCVGGRHKSC